MLANYSWQELKVMSLLKKDKKTLMLIPLIISDNPSVVIL